ncbi:hypothetical protein BJ138DRAFT_1124383 [Hygrophoropsis aurantiaca]|uniref:Uncharacterized protein n=1 Tax=Hygrophoropsis aurantiaca TaxID=72124 RepID=A0ACB8AIY6_9AGAM|nr:hypothetical protein BJ138DRAFT_1124383 [Hygrophoropsis aurantiaca]
MAPQHLPNLGPSKKKLTHAVAEDLAFQRLLRGYQGASFAEWAEETARYTPSENISTVVLKCQSCDNMENIDERLVERSVMFFQRENNKDRDDFLALIVRQIEAMKFAIDWSNRGKQKGGKTWKGKYYADTFKEHPDAKGLNSTDKRYAIAFKAFRNRHEKEATARNRLLDLYNTVCCFFSTLQCRPSVIGSQFGPGVFLDPLWDAYAHRGRDFVHVLESLCQYISTTTDPETGLPVKTCLIERHAGTADALLNFVKYLGGVEALEYVDNFLVTFPPAGDSQNDAMSP